MAHVPVSLTILDGLFREAWLVGKLFSIQTLTPDASQGVKHVRESRPPQPQAPLETLWVRASHSPMAVCAHFFQRLNCMELLTRPRPQGPGPSSEAFNLNDQVHGQQVIRTGDEMKIFYS